MNLLKMHDDIQVRIINDIKDIESIRDFWIENQWHLYSDIDYYIYELKTNECFLGPRIFVFYRDGNPIALIAGRIQKRTFHWKAGFLHFGCSEFACLEIGHHSMIGDFSSINKIFFGTILVRFLKTERLTLIYLDRIPIENINFPLLREGPSLIYRDPLLVTYVKHQLILPDSFDLYLKLKSRGSRKSINSYRNRLKKSFEGETQIVCYTDTKDVIKALTDIKNIALKTYQHKIGEGITHAKQVEEKWAYLAEKSILRAYVLYLKDHPSAFWVFYHYNNVHYSMFTGYDPEYGYYHIGINILLNIIEQCCLDADCKSIDYGLGNEMYKRVYSNQSEQVSNFLIFNISLKALWYKMLWVSTIGFAQFMTVFLKRMNIYQYVKMKWRKKVNK